MAHPLPSAQKWLTHPLSKVGNCMTHPLVLKHGCLVFPLNNPIKPCSVLDKIFWYIATQNHRNHTFHWKDKCEKPNISCFDGRYESWHKYSAKLGYIEIVRHKAYTKAFMIYFPEMLNRVILKENFFHFKGKHYLQNHGTAIGTLIQQFRFLCQHFHGIYWNNNSKQNRL